MQEKLIEGIHSLSYSIYGAGDPIVLIHGFGEDSRIWNQQVAFLQESYQLLLPDLPGSGASQIGENPLSIESMATCIQQMLDAENIQQCIMLGHSMGGYVTLAFAGKYPERLMGFGLIHSTAYADSEEKKAARQKSIGFIKEHGAFEFIRTSIPNLFAESFKRAQKEVVDGLIAQGNQFSADTLIAYYTAMINRPSRDAVLKKATVPVLFFIGEEDKAVSPADALEQSALPVVCMVQLVPGIAHMGMLEATDQLNQCLEEFCATVKQPSP
jgi:pimeloyl-ACP methyl ester carboxylesterase